MNERKDSNKNQQTKRSREQMLRARRRRRKKRLLRLVVLLLLLLAAFLVLIIGKFLRERMSLSALSRETMFSWDITSVDIVLDAGHGGKDQGANGDDVIEKEITLEIAKKTEECLKEAGYKVKLTRDEDTFMELEERAEYANRKKAKVFVSIHCNSSEDGEGNGIETFYSEQKGEESEKLAVLIQENLIAQTNARDREAKAADYTVIARTKMPAVLVETGFLSDAEERALLEQEEYQNHLAKGISDGIIAYLEQSVIE